MFSQMPKAWIVTIDHLRHHETSTRGLWAELQPMVIQGRGRGGSGIQPALLSQAIERKRYFYLICTKAPYSLSEALGMGFA